MVPAEAPGDLRVVKSNERFHFSFRRLHQQHLTQRILLETLFPWLPGHLTLLLAPFKAPVTPSHCPHFVQPLNFGETQDSVLETLHYDTHCHGDFYPSLIFKYHPKAVDSQTYISNSGLFPAFQIFTFQAL